MPDVNILIAAQDKASGTLKSIGGEIDNLGKRAGNVVTGGLGQLSHMLGTALKVGATAAVVGLGAMAAAVITTGVSFDNMKQQAMIAFTTMLGSGEQAKTFLDDLQKFAAQTPFEFPDLLRASQRLLAMGFAAEDIKPTLTAVGDAVAGLGGGAAEVDRVTTALGQMQAKGKASSEEMMQLTEAGIPAWQFLADAIGTDVAGAMKQVTAGAINAETVIGAVVDGMNKKFGGMMAQQSQTFGGLISTIKDTFTQLSGTVMQPLFDVMTKGLKSIVDWTSKPEFTAGVQKFAQYLADLLGKMITWATDVLPKAWAEVQKLGAQLKPVIDFLLSLATNIGKLAAPIIDLVGKFISWKDVLGALAIAIGVVAVSAIASFLVAIAPVAIVIGALVAAVALLRNAWERDWGGIQDKTKTAMDYLTTRFGALGQTIKTFGADALKEIGAFVTGNETQFTALGKIWDDTKKTAQSLFTDMGNSAKTIGGPFLKWFDTQFPAASAALKKAFEDVSQRLGELWDVIKKAFSGGSDNINKILVQLQAWWKDHGDTVTKIVDNFLKVVITVISSAIQIMTNMLKLFLQIISGDWKGAWQTIKDTTDVFANLIKTILGTAIDNIKILWQAGLDTVVSAIRTKLSEAVTAVTGKAAELVTGFVTGLANFVSSVAAKITEIKNAITAPFADSGNWLLSAGQNVVQGFINGIGNMIGAAQAKIAELANLAAAAAAAALGIGSPSKVFMGIGQNVAAGFGLGIEQGMDKLSPMMRNLNTWTPSMAGGNSTSINNSRSTSNQMIVQVQSTGDGVRDIRNQVELYALTFGAT